MLARLTFLGIACLWLIMNGLLWQAEYGSHAGDTKVPLLMVWRKILTTPDSSSLSLLLNGNRTGYCELSTSVSRELANVEEDELPPENLAREAGYQIHLLGNFLPGDITNRIKFDAELQFFTPRQWREIKVKLVSSQATVQIHATATNPAIHLLINSGGAAIERNIPLADLEKPDRLMGTILGDFGAGIFEFMDMPALSALPATASPAWEAVRTRVKIGSEWLPIYRLKSSWFNHDIIVDVSTLGEVLRVQLPGGLTAQVDEWNRHD